jgi:hypothetical protein
MEVMNSQNLTHKQAKQRVYGRVCEKVLVAFLICFILFFGIKLKSKLVVHPATTTTLSILVIRRGKTIEIVWRFPQIGFWLDALVLREEWSPR